MKEPRRPPRQEEEARTYGLAACRALFDRRPDSILRVYATDEVARRVGPLLKLCAERRRPYRVVGAEELEAVTESHHHEGLCIVATPRAQPPLEDVLAAPGPACLLGLAGVQNPHNLGAILRSAAHFEARALLVGDRKLRVAGAAARIAEGGAEWVDVVCVAAWGTALAACRAAGFTVVATASRGGHSLHAAPLPPRAVVLLGAERDGLPADLLRGADRVVSIPGSGHVDSLNVAAAAAVLLAESWRVRAR